MVNGTVAGIAASAFVAGAVLVFLILGVGAPPPISDISEITPAAGGGGSLGGGTEGGNPPAAPDPQEAEEDPRNRVVAIVDGAALRLNDLEAYKQMMPSELRELPVNVIYAPLLEQAITGEVLAAAGRKLRLDKAANVRNRVAFIEDRLIQSAYLARLAEEARQAPVADEQIQERYLAFLEAYEAEDEVRARHILLKTRQDAMEVIGQLEKGGDFAELAKKKSTGPSAAYGGDLGYFSYGEMETPFADAAFALKTGAFTRQPVKTKFGWHVIIVEDRRKKGPPALDEMRDKLAEKIAQEKVQASIDSLRSAVAIERYNPDGSPMKTLPADKSVQSQSGAPEGSSAEPLTYPNSQAD
ncbi:MAG: peptidylprolyl isomerase [Alphaproteobacteria bacterium]|nr:peptidylprolyl isomerase [Alphaproteobacteria bacterium]